MKKYQKYFFIIILLLSTYKVFSQEMNTKPKEYSSTEFSQWQLDLRRFEVITFGSIPFVSLDVIIIYSTIQWGLNDFQGTFPNPFSAMTNYSKNEIIGVLITTISISLIIAITDYIVNKNVRKKQNINQQQNIYVIPDEQNPINKNITDGKEDAIL